MRCLRKPPYWVSGVLGVAVLTALFAGRTVEADGSNLSSGATNDADALVERGRYVALASNCASCHTRRGGAPYAGGVKFETPVGTIYSSNITSSLENGIGKWTAEDLRRALHEGVAADGYRLFPAFPYTSFTQMTDEDVAALYAYMRTVAADEYRPPANDFLFKQRWAMTIWNALFFEPARFKPDPKQTPEWNRGAYLVGALGHCGACHTPRNTFMAEMPEQAYQGSSLREYVTADKVRDWAAVNLTSSADGLKTWSVDDLTKYLHTGFSLRGGAWGPMNDVVGNSTSKLTLEDARAMATYIKSLPLKIPPEGEATISPVTPEQAALGQTIYKDRCEKCHGASGRGGMFSGPPLAGNPTVQSADPDSLINAVLYGATPAEGMKLGAWETMKPYADVLSDTDIANVSNYVRGSWGNAAPPVDAARVAKQR
ncbi:cytochrome c [Peristeroidobacter agariperforans]|uniref:cytochrome c n=1 Tax=Peristeroidobacter agariperforans TaxID=268404 RepID=UPI00101DBB00|nr:cytochrome c [Peristeroidobacter agariperforans]